MKSKDVQTVLLSKYEKDNGRRRIFQYLNGTIRSNDGADESMKATLSPARPTIIRSKGPIEKVKTPLNRRNLLSSQKLARQLAISRSGVQRII